MPIHDHSYRHWEGELKSHTFRWWVITREGLRIILRRKLFLIFILAPAAISYLVHGVIIYVFTAYKGTIPISLDMDAKFFLNFFNWQTFYVAMICVFGGSGLISNDLKNNALQLYFSKSLTRRDYLVGKFAIIMVLMGFVTLVPGILLFTQNAVLSKDLTFLKEEYWIFGSIMLYFLILAFTTGFLILGLSSATKNNRYAAISFAAILIGTPIFSNVLHDGFRLNWAVFASYWSNMEILGKQVFGLGTPGEHGWYWSALIFLSIIGVCTWIMRRKVKGIEIVK